MTDSLYQTFGKLRFPTVAGDVTDGLQALDPARDALLDFFKAAINAELEAAWTVALGAAGSTQLGATPVVDAVPMLPSEELMAQRKGVFPALFLDRDLADKRNKIEPHSLWQERLVQVWGLHYVLPALTVGDRRKFGDVLINIVAVCHLAIKNARHPAYSSGAFFLPSIGISAIDLLEYQAGQAKFADVPNAPTYVAMSMTLQTWEVSGFVEGTEAPFTEMHIAAGTGNVEGVIPVTVEGFSEVPFQP